MIHFSVVTSRGIIEEADVHEVILPTTSGQIGVLQGHEPLLSVTSEGVIALRLHESDANTEMQYLAVSKDGIVEVDSENVRVLADEAIREQDIDERQAQVAYQAAQKLVSSAKDARSLEQAMADLDRSGVRLKIAELKRRPRSK